MQQAALTGESLPVEKEVVLDRAATDEPEAAHMVFLGTSVVSGSAIAEVTTTVHGLSSGVSQRAWPYGPKRTSLNAVFVSSASSSCELSSFSFSFSLH